MPDKNTKLRFGILLPTREAVMSGQGDAEATLLRFAERAEALGFHSVWVGDSLTARARVEALTTLAAVAGRTRRVRLGTSILLASLRHPVLLAYSLASLDWLSGGRVDLGIGYGRADDPALIHEFDILGLSAKDRIKISEETVLVMRRLWRENDVSHLGRHTRFEHVTIEPKPVQTGGVPIWLASNYVEPGLRRVARLGDGWLSNVTSPAVYRQCLEKIHGHAKEMGRAPEQIQPGLYLTLAAGGDDTVREAAAFLAEYYHRPHEAVAKAMACVTGEWSKILDRIQEYVEAGARTIIMRFAVRNQMGHLDACAEALQRHCLM